MTPATYARTHAQRFLTELQTYLRFPSVSTQPAHQPDRRACAHWLAEHLRQLGLRVHLHAPASHPILLATAPPQPHRPTLLIYGHYDVQPPDPLDQWRTPPFQPTLRRHNLYARGASDNKGQHFAHIKAIEALLRTGQPPPLNITLLIEGEEEIGSPNLIPFIRHHAPHLRAHYILISDTAMFARDLPAITYATRGLAHIELELTGPRHDLHSGLHGGPVPNPATVLAHLLATCTDPTGRVTIPGFYTDVAPITPRERLQWHRLPFHPQTYRRSLGLPALNRDPHFTPLEQRWARPTFEINGLTAGYQGPGTKTIIPARASAKITCRLVPNQNPRRILQLITRHLRRHCPPIVRLRIDTGAVPWFRTSPTGPGIRAAQQAIQHAFGRPPVLIREGGTLPILPALQRHLRAEILLIGLGLPDDNWHAPNEKLYLPNFHRGIQMTLTLLPLLADACPRTR